MQAAGLRREERAAMLLLDTNDYPLLFWGALKAELLRAAQHLLSASIYDVILRDSGQRVICFGGPV